MKNQPRLIAAVVALVLCFAVVDPLQISSGRFDVNSYSEIADELEKSTTTGVLVLASFADFYEFPVNSYLRDILGSRLAYHGEMAVEFGYDQVLAQASLGEESFLKYLKSKSISHLIIPKSTAETGLVFHRWSNHGSINIDLNSKSFSKVSTSGGSFPMVLYRVIFNGLGSNDDSPPNYSITWQGVRPEFYQLLRIIDEGYNVHYLRKYEERIDTAWIFEGEKTKLTLNSEEHPSQIFTVDLQFVAAYGDKAPPQVLRLSQGSNVKVITLFAGKVESIAFDIRHGQSIQIESILGCQKGVNFDPEGQDIREFCYGLRDVTVRVTN